MTPARIVLIEDNDADVLLVELALGEAGIDYSLTRFESGLDAVNAFSSENGASLEPTVILLDLNTPCVDGFAVLDELKQSPRLSGVPIAILTSSCAAEDKRRAALAGVRYIQKPSQLQNFLSSVGLAVREMLTAVGRPKPANATPE